MEKALKKSAQEQFDYLNLQVYNALKNLGLSDRAIEMVLHVKIPKSSPEKFKRTPKNKKT
jgi:hypothetical protein